MATLLAIHRPGGRTQRCDARCYQATLGSECDCVCGGVNHAKGLQQALILTRKQVQRWIEAARRRHSDIIGVEIGVEAQMNDLFLVEDIVANHENDHQDGRIMSQ
ncbi:hypothetical protein [Nonomuraea sp. NPDC005650]|uniref:hypothetical protein n=1 Tax=Nonomuraea sp. NPDC005650 TaxID=3157045 RepID=UPI0033B20144